MTAVTVNPCGTCRECRDGYGTLCAQNQIARLVGTEIPGAYAEFVKVAAAFEGLRQPGNQIKLMILPQQQ